MNRFFFSKSRKIFIRLTPYPIDGNGENWIEKSLECVEIHELEKY